MAQLAPLLKQRFLDANGDPLVGGKLYSYEAGTSTPLATYTDESAATANDNPVILDSNGEADVWLGSGAYKFTLFDADNNSVFTVDNVSTLADLSVLTAKIANSAVTTPKINDGAVTNVKLATPTFSTSSSSSGSTGTGLDVAICSAALTSASRPHLIIFEGNVTYTNGGATLGNLSISDGVTTFVDSTIGTDTSSEVLNVPIYITKFIQTPLSGTPDYEVSINSGDGTFVYTDFKITVMEL